MLIDTHAHINLHAFKDDADEVMRRSLSVGIVVINVGTDIETSQAAVNMLERYSKNVYAVVGLHPSHTYDNPHLDENESMSAVPMEHFNTTSYYSMAKNERVVGIGECGLDYYRLGDANNANEHANDTNNIQAIKYLQKEAFLQQIKLAQELDKALVIHCRPSKGTNDAYEDVLEILQNTLGIGVGASFSRPDKEAGGQGQPLRFEIHSFTGSLEVAEKFLALGGYIGLNGIITFDKTGNMETVVKGVPLERIVLETDSPYLAPAPNRGKRNEPVNVQEVASKIAEWKNVSVDEVARITTENAQRLFKISL